MQSVDSSTSLAQTIPNAHGFEFIITLPAKPGTDQCGSFKLKMIWIYWIFHSCWYIWMTGEQLTRTALARLIVEMALWGFILHLIGLDDIIVNCSV